MLLFPLIAFVGGVRAVDDPESRWLHAYVLAQTGNQLAEEELWGLAMANYAASLEEFDKLSTDYPNFQTELVGYRREELKTRLREALESIDSGEHDLAMLYEDVIETSRVGAKSRYRLDYATSYQYLVRAQWLMDDLVRKAPPRAMNALAKQKTFIDEITEASRESLMREPDGPLKVHNIEKDFASAASIAMSDLPSFREIKPASSGMSSALFPDSLVAQVRGEWYR